MYRKSLRFFLLPLLLLTLLRAALKVLSIDIETGFYTGAPLPFAAFTVLLIASAALVAFCTLREEDPGMAVLRGNRPLELAGVLLGLALIGVCGVRLFALLSSPAPVVPEVNVLPRGLRDLEFLLGIASGCILLWLAASSVSGAARSERNGVAALVLVLWQALCLVDRFISFRQVATVSDQLLETLFLLCSLLFWLAHARCMAGSRPSRRRVVLLSLLALLLGVPLAAGQAVALAALGECAGPDVLELLRIGAACLYFAAFLLAALRSPDALPAPESAQ